MTICAQPASISLFIALGLTALLNALPTTAVAESEKVLHVFSGSTDGALPSGGLIADEAGNLYGVTGDGGTGTQCYDTVSGCGVIFQIAKNGRESVLYSFQGGNDGWGPQGSLLEDIAGNLFGATNVGGGSTNCQFGCGTIFKFVPGGTETVVYAFQGGSDGELPWGNLIADNNENLFGVTAEGGNYTGSECEEGGCGTVFEVMPDGTKNTLYAFQGGSDGANPSGGLIADAAGNFYGLTYNGGGCSFDAGGCGTVFKVTSGGQETVLYAFQGGNDGLFPMGNLVADASGNLYGTTAFQGAIGVGTVFKISPSGQETTLYTFKSGNDGANPEAGLIMDKKGNLYGTTSRGGGPGCKNDGCGTIFDVTPKGKETVLLAFERSHGQDPAAQLLLGKHGDLYGTTMIGSKYKYGVAFELKKK